MKSTEYVCLGLIAVIAVIAIAPTVLAQDRCRTPKNTPGTCVSIYDCEKLLGFLTKRSLSQQQLTYLKQSQCTYGIGRFPFVCCEDESTGYGISNRFTDSTPANRNAYNTNSLLPQPGDCGIESPGVKIYKGKETELDEFPWLALLEYQRSNGKRTLNCGATLINNKYVLTAAHCVTGEIISRVGPLVNVRLGEYNTDTEIDCIAFKNKKDCADPLQNFGIEKVIVHPDYDSRNVNRHNDIALIRLRGRVKYSDFVAPICLPQPTFRASVANDNVYVSGFGRTLNASRSSIKQKLQLPIVDAKSCRDKFAAKQVAIGASQICAGGHWLEDTCDGDSGGPLMRFQKFWHLEGIVSFGYLCGLEGWPGIYTRVSSFMFWINDNVRP